MKKAARMICVSLIMLMLASCQDAPVAGPGPKDTRVEAGAVPEFHWGSSLTGWGIIKDRVLGTLQKESQGISGISQPYAYEANYYNVIGRLPVVDDVLQYPLYMPELATLFADAMKNNLPSETGGTIVKVMEENFNCSKDILDFTFHGSWPAGYVHKLRISNSVTSSLADIYGSFNKELDKDTVDGINKHISVIAGFEKIFSGILSAQAQAERLRRHAFSELSESDITALQNVLKSFFVYKQDPETQLNAFSVDEINDIMGIQPLLTKVDYDKLFVFCRAMMCAIDNAHEDGRDFELPRDVVTREFMLPAGRLIIGGTGEDIYTEDAFLIIDLGGNDTYRNNAGGTSLTGFSSAVVIDFAGDDRYESDRDCVQACGFGGVGAIMDFEGDDVYIAGANSQGVGLLGAGVLIDFSGNDSYSGDQTVQAAGIYGVGIIMEYSGDDRYECNAFGQGFGSTLGIGVLNDFGGDDIYIAGKKYVYDERGVKIGGAQGFGTGTRPYPWADRFTLYGGVGVLNEYAGNDRYKTAAYGQGSGYLFALGMLTDKSGNDVYEAEDFAQGSGTHLAAGVLVDAEGNDSYKSEIHSQGASLDRSAGVLFDVDGDDRYECIDGQGYAGKPRGFALLADYQGNDVHVSKNYGLGYARPSYDEYTNSWGIFMDLSGKDNYTNKADKCADTSEWRYGDWGYGMDYEVETLAGEIYFIGEHMEGEEKHSISSWHYLDDVFSCDKAIQVFFEKNRHTAKAFSELLAAENGSDGFMERHIADHLYTMARKKEMNPGDLAGILKLSYAMDAETRRSLLDMARVFNMPLGLEDIKPFLEDSHEEVRSFAVIILGIQKPEGGLGEILKKKDDSSWVVRRRVALSLRFFENDKKAADVLCEMLDKDADYRVRTQAAASFGFHKNSTGAVLQDKRHFTLLRRALGDSSSFVRYAAAKSLVNLGDKAGIEALIGMFDWDNWIMLDEQIVPFLRQMTGQTFGRGDVEKWRGWWLGNRNAYDLSVYSECAGKYGRAKQLLSEKKYAQAVDVFMEIKKIAASYPVMDKEFAGALNTTAWELSRAKDIGEAERKKALEYALLAVKIGRQPAYLDTLAEAYFMNGEIDKAIEAENQAVESAPEGNDREYFKFQLERFKKAK